MKAKSSLAKLSLLLSLSLGLVATATGLGPPTPIPLSLPPWYAPAPLPSWDSMAAKHAIESPEEAAHKAPKTFTESEDKARTSSADAQKQQGIITGAEKGLGSAKQVADLVREILPIYKELSQSDTTYGPNYIAPGSPSVPSKCMEDDKCLPCFEKAHAGLNKSRMNLEKVRARYNFTHRFTKLGQSVLTSAGAAGGGISALGATHENIKIDKALADFDDVVKAKNKELLAKLEGNLKEISACEAQFYKNDDWYNRYGFTYYQFMLSSYGY